MKLKLTLGIVAAVAAILFTVKSSEADPNLGNVGAHRHFVRQPDGSLVEVGPRLCDNPRVQKAFNQFHNNIHLATTGGIGPVAPGLHNFQGADLFAAGCSFVP